MKSASSIKKQHSIFFLKELFWGCFYAGLFALFCGLLFFFYVYFFVAPKAKELPKRKTSQTTTIYDRTGEHVLYEIHGEENRKTLEHSEIPNTIRIATIAAEDASFYQHFGIDIISILRALKVNIANNQMSQGASTITQQLARNVFLDRDKNLSRKFMEMIMAIKLERKFTKNEILDFYLNQIPYGSNAYGVETAAQIFFGKHAIDLTLDEAALMAALPKATSYYSPYGNHQKELLNRQRKILYQIQDLNLASNEAIQKALNTDTFKKLLPPQTNIEAPHFVSYVKDFLEKEYGLEALEENGFKVYTTLDYDMQKRAEESVRLGAEKNKKYNASNAAMVVVNPKSGEMLAMVGSKDFFDTSVDGQVNVADSLRQPGSSFKPIVYTKAFEKGYQPETILFDNPTNFGADGSGKDYIPNDYDGQFRGAVSMRQALAMSLNIPAVQTLYLAGINESIDFAHKLGITTLNERGRYGLSLVLGGGEVKLIDMTNAFSVFANDGVRATPIFIQRISDANGKIIKENSTSSQRVIDAQIARKIDSILSDNSARAPIFGTNSPLGFKNRMVAAKTGTTQEFRDAWTIGFTPSIAVGVWVGNNDNTPMKAGSDGVYVAAPIWRDFIDKELSNLPIETFPTYEKIISDKPLLTGQIPETKIEYYKIASGKKISSSKAKKYKASEIRQQIVTGGHSILFYVNKDNPLSSDPPNLEDPMLLRWEIDPNQTTATSLNSPTF
jgi:1A family penicillin-binding protein